MDVRVDRADPADVRQRHVDPEKRLAREHDPLRVGPEKRALRNVCWRTAPPRGECTAVYSRRPPAGPPMVAAVTGFPARIRRRPHGGPAPSRGYERRRPEKTPLHKVVSENLESWLAWREAAERPVSGYVKDELRGYLACGILCFGFARAVCMTCRTGFVVAFSCKGRGVCPSCNGRHMARDCRPPRRSRHPAGARADPGVTTTKRVAFT